MVTSMHISHRFQRFASEFRRALSNFHYERTPSGVYFPKQRASFGGAFRTCVDGGAWSGPHPNTVALECIDAMLSCYFDQGQQPVAFFLAPFSNNTTPNPSLTAATFAQTQGEYVGYTQATRVPWTPNGPSESQTVSNSSAPANFTIGAAAVTVTGAGLIATASGKGATTGVLAAAALFGAPNSLNPGSTLSIQYSLSGTPS